MDDDLSFWGLGKGVVWTFIVGLIIGLMVLGWIFFLGPLYNQASYNNFNNSPQHLNAVAGRFADDCRQIAETTDPVAIKAIEQDIYTTASTVDLSRVQMPDVTRSCVNKAINDVSSNK